MSYSIFVNFYESNFVFLEEKFTYSLKVKSFEYTLNYLKKRSDDLKSSHFKLRRHTDGQEAHEKMLNMLIEKCKSNLQ